MTVKSVNQTGPSALCHELQAYYAPPDRASLALVSFNDLGFDLCKYPTELQRCAYIPKSQIASHLVDKDRLNASLGSKFDTLTLTFLRTAADQPASKPFGVEVRSQGAYVPLYSADAQACDYSRDPNRLDYGHQ